MTYRRNNLINLLTVLTMIGFALLPAQSLGVGGYSGVDNLGQIEGLDTPVYTSSSTNNAFSFWHGSANSLAIDTVNHRLFVAKQASVWVYELDGSDQIVDYVPDYVIGQSTFKSFSGGLSDDTITQGGDVAYDATKDWLLVADGNNNRVMFFDVASISNGESAFAVLGQSDFTSNGSGTTQSGLFSPYGLALDETNERLFVTEGNNNRVSIFDIASVSNGEAAIDVLGQTDFTTNTSGLAHNKLKFPWGAKYDPVSERLFVGDSQNNRVMVFDVDPASVSHAAINVLGQTSFTSATWSATPSQSRFKFGPVAGFIAAVHMEYDSATDYLYVPDNYASRVLVFDGSLANFASSGNGMNAEYVLGQASYTASTEATTQSRMYNPTAAVISGSKLYISDDNNGRILRFDASALANGMNASDAIGPRDNNFANPVYTERNVGPSPQGLNSAFDVALDTVNHRLFVPDAYVSAGGNSRVLVFDLDTNNQPIDHVADYVLGATNFIIDAPFFGSPLTELSQARAYYPHAVEYDSVNERLFVSDNGYHRVLVWDLSGGIINGANATYVLGQPDFATTTVSVTQQKVPYPEGLQYDPTSDRLFVADGYGSPGGRVLVWDFNVYPLANYASAAYVLGKPSFTSASCTVGSACLQQPSDIYYDADGSRLFVADKNNRVLMWDLSGGIVNGAAASKVLGQANLSTTTAGTTAARLDFNSAFNLGIRSGLSYDDSRDFLYVSDPGNSRVMVFDVASVTNGENAVDVIGQSDFTTGSSTGTTTQSTLYGPVGSLFEPVSEQFWVADFWNNRVMAFAGSMVASVPNDPPSIVINSISQNGGADLEVNATFSDADNDALSGTISAQCTGSSTSVTLGSGNSYQDFVSGESGAAIERPALTSTGMRSNPVGHFSFACGPCGATTTPFASSLRPDTCGLGSPAGMVTKDICVRSNVTNRRYTLDVTFYAAQTANPNSTYDRFEFAEASASYSGLLPPYTPSNVSLAGLSGSSCNLRLTASDGNSLQTASASQSFNYQSEEQLTFGSGGFSPSTPTPTPSPSLSPTPSVSPGPTPAGVIINGGATTTNSRYVALDLESPFGSETTEMRLINDSEFTPEDRDILASLFQQRREMEKVASSSAGEFIQIASPSATTNLVLLQIAADTASASYPALNSGSLSAYQPKVAQWDLCRGGPVCNEGKYNVYVQFTKPGAVAFSTSTLAVLGDISSGPYYDDISYQPPSSATAGGSGGGGPAPTPAPTVGPTPVPSPSLLPTPSIFPPSPSPTPSAPQPVPGIIGGLTEVREALSVIIPITSPLAAAATATAAASAFFAVLALGNVLGSTAIYISYLRQYLLEAFGLKKRPTPWGTVYNANTKQPLPYSKVELLDDKGRVLETRITGPDGMYGFLASAGFGGQTRMVQLKAYKPQYAFPSTYVTPPRDTILYSAAYIGGLVTISENMPVNFDLPMDPARPPFSEKNLNAHPVITNVLDAGFWLGVVLIPLNYVIQPNNFHLALLIVFWVANLGRIAGLYQKPFGVVSDLYSNEPMPFALITLNDLQGKRAAFTVSNERGRYVLFAEKGTYSLSAYTPAAVIPSRMATIPVTVRKGWLKQNIKL